MSKGKSVLKKKKRLLIKLTNSTLKEFKTFNTKDQTIIVFNLTISICVLSLNNI